MTFDFDLFVIGGGSGGVRAGRVAAEGGARVALAEEYRMGGTCVIRGCVPKKLMVFASGFGRAFEDARDYGWKLPAAEGFDWASFRTRMDSELDRLENIYRTNLGKPGTTIYDCRATVAGPHEVRLATGETVTAKHILVATGGWPALPEGVPPELVMTSNEVFKLESQPKSILIVGGGYIACEFACIFQRLGTPVTQAYRGEQILRGFDNEARDLIAEQMKGQGIDLRTHLDVTTVEKVEGGLDVTFTDGTSRVFEKVLYATGRTPNTKGLGLEDAGVRLGRNGAVIVDEYSQTNIPSIYAVGDVTDRVQLTPVAIREGAAFVETVFKGNPVKVSHDDIASAIFTQPEYGSVGLTEEQAAQRGGVEIYGATFRPMQTSFLGRPDKVMFKLVVDAVSRRVLGCHIVAPGAGEMIQFAGVLVKMGATKEDFDAAVAVHPTMAEEIVLLKRPTRTH